MENKPKMSYLINIDLEIHKINWNVHSMIPKQEIQIGNDKWQAISAIVSNRELA